MTDRNKAFAAPVNQIGYCYVPNTQGYDFPDRRDLGIQSVLYEIITKRSNEVDY